jgi:Tfp pilus assembly protein PilN
MEQVINSSENKIKLKEIEEEDRKISIMKNYYTKVEPIDGKIATQDVLSSKLIGNVSSCIPKDVYFKSISMDPNVIQILGDGISRIAIADLEHKLKALDTVENVHIASISKASEEKQTYAFSLKCMLKDVVNNEGN